MDDEPRNGFVVAILVCAAIGSVIYAMAGIGLWTVWQWITGG